MPLNQESNKQPILKQAFPFLPNGWPDPEKVAVAAIRITAGLAVLAVLMALAAIICDCDITTWHWLQLLIVPATIAGFSIWFNWAQKKRDKEREVREANIKALQGNKESIAYVAHLAKESSQEDILEDADFRDKFWPALCLAAVLETSDRTNAVIIAALKRAVKNSQHNEKKLIQQTLVGMKQDFDELYIDSLGYEKVGKDKGPIDNFENFKRRRRQLEALINTLGLQDYAQQAALQAYLDQISQLLNEQKGTPLQQLHPDADVSRSIAARTETVLKELDKNLTEAKLTRADLTQAKLTDAQLNQVRTGSGASTIPDGSKHD